MVLPFSFVCKAEPLTGHFIITLEQNAGFPNPSFSIKRDQLTLPGNPSDIADTNDDAKSDSLPDDKRHRPDDYEVKTPPIESISWQWLHTAKLLIAYELFLTTKNAHPGSKRLPVEVVVAVGWLLKSYCHHSPLFNTIERQSAAILKQWYQLFSLTTMMTGCEHDQQKGQSSGSSVQPAPATHPFPAGYFTGLLFSASDEGNEDPQQYQHTLDLDCFVYPCHGVCRFRPLSDSRTLDFPDSSTGQTGAIAGQSSSPHFADRNCYRWPSHSQTEDVRDYDQNIPLETFNDPPAIQLQCASGQLVQAHGTDGNRTINCSSSGGVALDWGALDWGALDWGALDELALVSMGAGADDRKATGKQTICNGIVVREDAQPQSCGRIFKNLQGLSHHKGKYHGGQKACDVPLVGEDGQQRPCGEVCKSTQAVTEHKRTLHSGQQTCSANVVGKDGEQRPCGRLCKNALALASHKNKFHSGQKACGVTVFGKDGQQRPCGAVCKNSKALTDHKITVHSRQQTCDMIVVWEDGEQRECGKDCKNTKTLYSHRSKHFSRIQTCDLTVIAESDQEQQCGKVCKSAVALSNHKTRDHTKQQTCDLTVVTADSQQRPCGVICKSTQALRTHKNREHCGQKTCDVTVVGENGQPRPCRLFFKNLQSLSSHKSRFHRRQKAYDVTVVAEDSQPRPYGKICENAGPLTDHKRRHRKRKPVDADHDSGLSHPVSEEKE
ncbi:hypothetical protein [Endozoicomonas sp. 8E]|uniref:hypothetical protein n=1 Tax=Endozoicomonas sp. 8E TaxID=3035692 RepID=UPI002938DFFA|nr:hypothetical protein [Endozoicomonas sp. 8E]WOG27024.1 hypothetical protein P6910_21100 [Endozoicomonas sp. 8E]